MGGGFFQTLWHWMDCAQLISVFAKVRIVKNLMWCLCFVPVTCRVEFLSNVDQLRSSPVKCMALEHLFCMEAMAF